MSTDCIFCRIMAGQAPASVIYQDEATFAFMDTAPVTRGHALVIPRQHVENVYRMSDEQVAAVGIAAARVARAMKAALEAAGINFWMANEPPAGQVVMHAHMHVIPRYPGDGFGMRRPQRDERPPSGRPELDQLAAAVRRQLDGDRHG